MSPDRVSVSPAIPPDATTADVQRTPLAAPRPDAEPALLAALFEYASDAVVAVDGERRVVRGNPAAVALLGPVEPGALTCGEYLGCDKRAGAASDGAEDCPFLEVLAGASAVVARDRTAIGCGSARVPVAATYARLARPAVDGTGDLPGVPAAVGIFRDLRGAQAIDELKSSFVAAVSHELRTPLALISGYSQSLLELELDEGDRRRFVERIDGTANRMRGLVDQLLDVATLESDRLSIDPRRISLRPLLKSIIDEVAEMPGSLAVSLSVPPDLPPVLADPIRIGQVFANLLDNARKYGRGGSMVTIRVVRTGRAADRALITVDNEGAEIAPDERELLFERFYRGRAARNSATPGIGLGLHLCRRLVEAHGGEIWLTDRRGGTCVALTLPLALDGWSRAGGTRGLSATDASTQPEAGNDRG